MSNSILRNKSKEFGKNIVFLCRNIKSEHKETEQTAYKEIQNDCGAIRRMLIASLNTIKAKQE